MMMPYKDLKEILNRPSGRSSNTTAGTSGGQKLQMFADVPSLCNWFCVLVFLLFFSVESLGHSQRGEIQFRLGRTYTDSLISHQMI